MPISSVQNLQRADLKDWMERRQSQLKITTSTTTAAGHTVDWIPIESQVEKAVATPPPATPEHTITDKIEKLAAPEHTITDKIEKLAAPTKEATTHPANFDEVEKGPAGHVPVLRPDLSKLPANLTLQEVLAKRGGLKINPVRKSAVTDPNPAGYFHASSGQTITAYGCDAWLNVWDPQIDIPSSPGDDHSISQTWLQNYQGQLQSLEAGLTVDKGLNGDSANHIFTYYTTNGYTKDGDNLGGYNRLEKGWVQYHPTIFPGIRVNGASTPGGTQLEIAIKFQLWQGNWWFGVNNNESGPWIWIGYYPAKLFNGRLGNEGNWVGFGGEVYSALKNPCQTTDQMGSGHLANAGWARAAYQRLLHTQSNTGGSTVNFNGAPEVDAAAANCPKNQYSIHTFMNSGTSWGSYQYYGGQAV